MVFISNEIQCLKIVFYMHSSDVGKSNFFVRIKIADWYQAKTWEEKESGVKWRWEGGERKQLVVFQ
jgi:hypothetical protein